MKKIALLLPLLFSLSCSTIQKESDNSTNPELNGFKDVIKHVHSVAKVNITHVDIIKEDDNTDKHVYSAEVLSTYRGQAQNQIHYEMLVEKGEEAVVENEPVYIALCIDNEGALYWPGTGSLFSSNDAIKAWLAKNNKSVSEMPNTASWCN